MSHLLDLDQAVVIPWFFAGLAILFVALLLCMVTEGGQYGLFRLSRWLDAVVVFVGKAAAWLFIPMMLVILFDVITRRAEGTPWGSLGWLQDALLSMKHGLEQSIGLTSTKLQELEWHLHTALLALCFGFAYIANAHVRIDLIREKLKPRTQQWIELIGALLIMLPYCGITFLIFLEYAANSYDQGEGSAALTGLPLRWIIKSFLPLGMAIAAFSAIAVIIRRLLLLFAAPALLIRVERFEARTLVQTADGD